MLSKIQHPNVISLLGYSSYGDTRFIVYELMQNGSLETQLHGKTTYLVPYVLDGKSCLKTMKLLIDTDFIFWILLNINFQRTLSWLGIDLAHEDEDCP